MSIMKRRLVCSSKDEYGRYLKTAAAGSSKGQNHVICQLIYHCMFLAGLRTQFKA